MLTRDLLTGVAADLSHINTNSTVTGYDPTPSGLRDALKGSEIVLIPAGVPRKPGMTRDGMCIGLFNDARTITDAAMQISSTPMPLLFVTSPRLLLRHPPRPTSWLSQTPYVSQTIISDQQR